MFKRTDLVRPSLCSMGNPHSFPHWYSTSGWLASATIYQLHQQKARYSLVRVYYTYLRSEFYKFTSTTSTQNCVHPTSRILSRFSLTSGSAGSPSLTPTTLGMGTGGRGLGASFFFRSSTTLFFSVWISAFSSSRVLRSFSLASCRARSWSARILSRRLSSSSLQGGARQEAGSQHRRSDKEVKQQKGKDTITGRKYCTECWRLQVQPSITRSGNTLH